MQMINYYFVCVNYNNAYYTIDFVKSILSQNNYESFIVKIFLVDNNSEYKDYEKIEEFSRGLKNVTLIRNDSNLGYFGGLNIVLKEGKIDCTSYWIIGNNDLSFDPDFLINLNDLLLQPLTDDILIIAPNIINLDNDNQNPVSINKLSYYRKTFLKVYFSNYYIGIPAYYLIQVFRKVFNKSSRAESSIQQKIFMAYGACYILLPKFFNYYNKLDDRTFLYGEEALLSNQVYSAGGSILYCPSLKITHHEHATIVNIRSLERYKITQNAYKLYRSYL